MPIWTTTNILFLIDSVALAVSNSLLDQCRMGFGSLKLCSRPTRLGFV